MCRCLGARAGVRRRPPDARQGRLAARSGVDGPHRPRSTATTSRCCGRCSASASPKTCRSRPRSRSRSTRASTCRADGSMAMMSSNQDLEAIVGWRFQRSAVGAGARLESTVFVGGDGPAAGIPQRRHAGSAFGPCVRGERLCVADRTTSGSSGGYQHFGEREGDQMGDSFFYSAVYGYRPPFLRPTIRSLTCASLSKLSASTPPAACTTASRSSRAAAIPSRRAVRRCCSTSSTGSKPASLFPVYQQTNFQPEEKFRFGVNFTYFFWRK